MGSGKKVCRLFLDGIVAYLGALHSKSVHLNFSTDSIIHI